MSSYSIHFQGTLMVFTPSEGFTESYAPLLVFSEVYMFK